MKLKLAARSNLMRLNKILKNTLLVLTACLVLSACATKKEASIGKIEGQMQGDVYTGTDTVEYLAEGVPDRVFLQQMSQF